MQKLTRDEIKTLIEDCGGRPTMLHTGVGAGDTYQLAGYFKEDAAFVIPVIARYLERHLARCSDLSSCDNYLQEALSYIEGQTEVMDWDSRDSNGWQTVLRFKESPIELLSDAV